MKERTYICCDLKSFYASVECIERGLNPLDTNLGVADLSRTDVYKRQRVEELHEYAWELGAQDADTGLIYLQSFAPVAYTHLVLPGSDRERVGNLCRDGSRIAPDDG